MRQTPHEGHKGVSREGTEGSEGSESRGGEGDGSGVTQISREYRGLCVGHRGPGRVSGRVSLGRWDKHLT